MERPAKYNPNPTDGRLAPGEYRFEDHGGDKLSILFRLPLEMDPDERLHTVPLGGGYAWTLHSRDPITISPSIWYNKGEGKDKGEWHGFLRDGKFIQV